MQLHPYLNFNGRCAEAFRFYEQVFGGQAQIMTHGESPYADEVAPEWRDKVIHARLEVGEQVLMGADSPPEHYRPPQGFSVSLMLPEPTHAERVFAALAEGGMVTMPIQQTFWATRFGMLIDRFAIPWMINCEAES